MGRSTVDKAWIAADPAAALIGYISTILATFGVFESLHLSADQVATLGGAILGVCATVRTLVERERRRHLAHLKEKIARKDTV